MPNDGRTPDRPPPAPPVDWGDEESASPVPTGGRAPDVLDAALAGAVVLVVVGMPPGGRFLPVCGGAAAAWGPRGRGRGRWVAPAGFAPAAIMPAQESNRGEAGDLARLLVSVAPGGPAASALGVRRDG